MDSVPVQILKYLEPFGVGNMVNINGVLLQNFPLSSTRDDSAVYDSSQAVKALLKDMSVTLSPALIRVDDTYINIGHGPEENKYWLHNLHIKACILTAGLEFLAEANKKNAELELLEVQKKNAEWQIKFGNKLLVLSVVAAFFSGAATVTVGALGIYFAKSGTKNEMPKAVNPNAVKPANYKDSSNKRIPEAPPHGR